MCVRLVVTNFHNSTLTGHIRTRMLTYVLPHRLLWARSCAASFFPADGILRVSAPYRPSKALVVDNLEVLEVSLESAPRPTRHVLAVH